MRRILFVDDEASVLEGLENRLRRFRHEWSIEFALGGKQAIEKLASAHFDVIVTDMRMPGIDGAELLHHVREHYGHMVRIVLTGQTEKDRMLRALCVAHQVLNKPSDAQTIRNTVEHISALQEQIRNPMVCDAVTAVSELPSLPKLFIALTELVNQDDFALADVIELVENDPSMVARILQVVNSTFYGLSRTVVSTADAVALLGVNTLRCIVLTVELFSALKDEQPDSPFSFSEFYRHSIYSVRLVKHFLKDSGHLELGLNAALLHDIGELVLATALPDQYRKACRLSVRNSITQIEAEKQVKGFTHADVGAYLLSLWNIPFSIVEVAANHHQPSRSSAGQIEVCSAVHVADELVNIILEHGDHPLSAEQLLQELQASPSFEREFFTNVYSHVDLKIWCAYAVEELMYARS